MKLKFLALVALITVLSGCLWLWLGRSHLPQHSPSPEPSAGSTQPQAAFTNSPKSTPQVTPPVPQAAPATAESVSPVVNLIADVHVDYRQRSAAIRTLTTNLSQADQQALRAFLLQKDATDADQFAQECKNLVMNALRDWNPPPAWLGDTLIQIYHDRSQNVVMRDYAVQHLMTLHEQIDMVHVNDPQTQQSIQQALWEALSESDNSIAGTALLGLKRLSDDQPQEFDRDRIAKAALQLAEGNNTGELARITAFQVCASLGLKDALPFVWNAAQRGETIPIQISAISALGALGGSEVKPFLTNLLNGSDPRFKPPAQTALSQIQSREQSAARPVGKAD